MTPFERTETEEPASSLTELSPPRSAVRLVRDDAVSAAWVLAIVLRNRWFVAGGTGVVMLFSIAAASLRPPIYAVAFSFLPQATQSQGTPGLAALAGQFGVSLNSLSASSQPPQFYADLLQTHELLAPIARDSVATSDVRTRIPLSTFLHIGRGNPAVVAERTIERLRDRVVATSVSARTTGIVSVVVRTTSPEASFEIAQRLLDGLNQFNLMTRQSQATAERRFIEGRLDAARIALRAAEDALQNFLQGNRQVSNSPPLVFRQQRLEREVTLQQQVVSGLAQQYEDARIREVRDTPVITMIDRPIVPALPEPKHLARNVAVAAFIALLTSLAFVIVRGGWQRRREVELGDPDYAMLDTELRRLRPWARSS